MIWVRKKTNSVTIFNCKNIILVAAGALAADSPKEVRIFERIYRQKLLLACKAMHDPKPNVNSELIQNIFQVAAQTDRVITMLPNNSIVSQVYQVPMII